MSLNLPDLSKLEPADRERIIRSQLFVSAAVDQRQCKLCPLWQRMHSGPVAAEGSPMPLLAILTSYVRAEKGAGPLSPRAREVLRAELARNSGLTWDKVTVVPSVGCAATHQDHADAARACAGNVQRVLGVTNPDVVLVVGQRALQAIKPALAARWEESRGGGWLEPAVASYRAYFVIEEPELIVSSVDRVKFEMDMKFLGRVLQWKFVEKAAKAFRIGAEWPSLIDETLAGLDPFETAQHKGRFLGRVIEKLGHNTAATATAIQQGLAVEFDQAELLERN